MKKVFIVFEPASDPYAGVPYIVDVYSDAVSAAARVIEYNHDKKYEWEKLFVEEFEVLDGKDH